MARTHRKSRGLLEASVEGLIREISLREYHHALRYGTTRRRRDAHERRSEIEQARRDYVENLARYAQDLQDWEARLERAKERHPVAWSRWAEYLFDRKHPHPTKPWRRQVPKWEEVPFVDEGFEAFLAGYRKAAVSEISKLGRDGHHFFRYRDRFERKTHQGFRVREKAALREIVKNPTLAEDHPSMDRRDYGDFIDYW